MDAAAVSQGRLDVAAALRLACRNGFHEGICNHFSYMVPGSDAFLINPQGVHWSEVTASSLVLLDADGKLLEGDAPPEPTAFYIHWRIHRGAPHARAVLHTHMPWATTLACLEEDSELAPISQTALGFHGRVAYDEQYNGLALDDAEGDRMMARLGNKSVLFLANHGVVVCGPDMAVAFNDLYYLERACQLQVQAMWTGRRLRRIAPEVVEKTAQQFGGDSAQVQLHFAALKRVLDRDEPEYRH